MKIIFKDEAYEDRGGDIWELTIYDTIVIDLDGNMVNSHSIVRVLSEKEIYVTQKQFERNTRIMELKEIISNKKLLDIDCREEQNELKDLLNY